MHQLALPLHTSCKAANKTTHATSHLSDVTTLTYLSFRLQARLGEAFTSWPAGAPAIAQLFQLLLQKTKAAAALLVQ